MAAAVGLSSVLGVDRLPVRIRRVALQWLSIVERRFAAADRQDHLAAVTASLGQAKEANTAMALGDAWRQGYADADAAKQGRLAAGTDLWESKYGRFEDPDVQARLAAYQTAKAERERAEAQRATARPRRRKRRR